MTTTTAARRPDRHPDRRSTAVGRPGDPRLRPQRGRLRGARRPARGRRLPARRRPRGRRHRAWSTPAASSRRPRRTPSTPCWRPPTSRRHGGTRRPSSRSAAWPSATARTSPSRCPRPTRCSASTTTPTSRRGCARSSRGRPTTRTRPQDRRRLLPISPGRPRRLRGLGPGPRGHRRSTEIGRARPASGPRAVRRRLDAGPMAPLKLASGCDRRCSFCAIPSFRGSFVSRRPSDVLQRGALAGRRRASGSCSWSARTPRPTARTSATCGCSRRCCPSSPPSTASSGCGSPTSSPPRPGPAWSRRSPPRPGVAPYFDLSFQHASATVLRRMRRFGDPESFLGPARADPRARPRRPGSAPT